MKTPDRFPTATRHRGAFRGCPAILCSVALSVSILLLCHPSAPPLAEPGVSTLHIPIFLTPLFPTPPVFSRNARFATNLLSRRSLSSIHFAPKHPKKLGFSPSPFFYKNASAAGAPSTPHLGPPPSPESSCLIFLRTPGRLRPQSSSDPPSRRDPMRLPAVPVFSWHGRRHSRPAFTPIILASQNARPSDCRASVPPRRDFSNKAFIQTVPLTQPYPLPPPPCLAALHLLYSHRTIPQKGALK